MQPEKLIVALGCGGAFLLLTCALVAYHQWELAGAPISMRRTYYSRIGFAPLIMGATAYVALWSPVSIILSGMLQKLCEAVLLSTFGMLVFLLLWHESQNAMASSSEKSKVDIVLGALALQGPKKHWGPPPLGFCFRPCLPAHDLSVRNLSFIFWLVRQYVIITPCIGTLGLLFLTAFRMDELWKCMRVMKFVLLASNVLCLYGLLVAYNSTHDLLHQWGTTKKFISIKVVLIVMVYQEFLLGRIGPGILEKGQSCFRHVGFVKEWSEVETRYWSMFLLTFEMALMAVALRRSFPVADVMQPITEIHHAFLDMEMSRVIGGGELEEHGVGSDGDTDGEGEDSS
uniref:Uncharacterized protein n=1 Tax=Alexandrium catenella TaxID=2925 RepID=A0A7S1WUN0_ALECA|mmetsp:Transcript_91211/g.242249  ORF Transcript_91211/g.242249 Transcript_91211/m.242249 type:complete len:343 (+) Transcript_91211:3-1031(+)